MAAPARAADRVQDLAKAATTQNARLGAAGICPLELTEAVAALQDLAVGSRPAARPFDYLVPGRRVSH